MKYIVQGKEQMARNKPIKKVIHDNVAYFSVPDAARFLGTSAPKVREMMGNGGLEWKKFKENGKLFVTAKSLSDRKASTPTKAGS
jgi:hypothetical protein